MIITYLLYEKKIQKVIAYHGTDNEFEEFDYSYIGMGKEEYGPGFYFADRHELADRHGKVGKYELILDKYLKKGKKLSKSDISRLIKWAPGYEDILSNFSERPEEAFYKALELYSDESFDKVDSYFRIWHDFYKKRGNSRQFVENLVRLGYDGYIIEEPGLNTYVMYNINNIRKL